MASAWGTSWGTAWLNAWSGETPPASVIIYGGDDAPRRRRKKERTYHDLYREIDATIRDLLHPSEPVESQSLVPASSVGATAPRMLEQQLDELVVLAQGQHALLQRVATLRAELAAAAAAYAMRMIDEDDLDWEWFL